MCLQHCSWGQLLKGKILLEEKKENTQLDVHVLPDLAETQGEHASPLRTTHLKLQLRQESENPTEHTFLLAGVPDDGNTQIDEPKFFNKQLEIE